MLYIGMQISPVPGKRDELLKANTRAREIAEANGAQLIGGFQVAFGPELGSLVYIVGYADGEAYLKATKALDDAGLTKETESLIAKSSSWALEMLPEAALQAAEPAVRELESAHT